MDRNQLIIYFFNVYSPLRNKNILDDVIDNTDDNIDTNDDDRLGR